MLEIKDTNPNEPARLFIYGDGGLGKSTLIARSDKPILLAVEKGSARLTDEYGRPIKMMSGIEKWDDVLAAIKWLRNEKHDFKTVGLDSATEIERLAIAEILKGSPGKSIITVDKGYGAGDKRSGAMHKELIEAIEDLRLNRDMHILVTGHQKVKTAKDPAMIEDYDTFEPKFQTAEPMGLWKEYVDATIFVRMSTFLKTDDQAKARALTDGKRVAYTTQNPAFYAKNRFGLPSEMEFTFEFWNNLKPYLEKGVLPFDFNATYQEIISLISMIPNEQTQKMIMQSLDEAGKNEADLKMIKNRLLELTSRKGA